MELGLCEYIADCERKLCLMVFTKRYRKKRTFARSITVHQLPEDMLICCRTVVIHGVVWGRFGTQKTLAMSGDIFGHHNWSERCCWHPVGEGLTLNALQCTGQDPQQRIIWSEMSTVSSLKNHELE